MMDCKPMSIPMETNLLKLREAMSSLELVDPTLYRQIIGSLMYLINSRPNICYAINILSQFIIEPKQLHMSPVQHILRYLRGTIEYGLLYKNEKLELHDFSDSDWVGCSTDRQSTLGCFSLGSAMISWLTKKQNFVAQISTEAEYIVASLGAREAIWLRKLLV